jgi:hypothetical protein
MQITEEEVQAVKQELVDDIVAKLAGEVCSSVAARSSATALVTVYVLYRTTRTCRSC